MEHCGSTGPVDLLFPLMTSSSINACVPRRQAAFSLPEVTLAAGIAAVGIIMLFGLLPSGLTMFRDSMNVSTSSQIAQRLIYEAVQTDYDVLVESASGGSGPVLKAWRYFDDQGVEVETAAAGIYHVLTRVLPSSQLPTGGTGSANDSLATVTVQVVVNPSNRTVPLRPAGATDPLARTVDPESGMTFYTYNSHVARAR